MQEPNDALTLLPGENILQEMQCDCTQAHGVGFRAVPGRLWLTDQRILFCGMGLVKSLRLVFAISYEDIVELEPFSVAPFIRTGIWVVTREDGVYSISIMKRKAVMDTIRKYMGVEESDMAPEPEPERPMPSVEELECQEPLFVNQCTFTKEALIKLSRYLFPTWKRIYVSVMFASAFFVAAVFWYLENWFGMALFLLLPLALGVVLFCGIGWRVNRIMKQNQALYHSPDRLEVSFYEDGMLLHNLNSNGKAVLGYDQIQSQFQSQKNYFLGLNHRLSILLDKDGFQRGNPEDFVPFLRKKTVQWSPSKPKAWVRAWKLVGTVVGALLLCAAILFLSAGAYMLWTAPPVSAYTDTGVHTFVPCAITHIDSEQSGSVEELPWLVEYVAEDNTGYRTQLRMESAQELAQLLLEQYPIERRVLELREEQTYQVVPVEETVEHYVHQENRKSWIGMVLFAEYIGLYAAIWCILIRERRKKRSRL